MPIAFIFSLLFSILVVVFALQNSGSVTINVLTEQYTMSQAIVILISAIFGAIIVLLLSMVKQIKSSFKSHNLTGKVNKLEKADRKSKENEKLVDQKKLENENKLLKEKENENEQIN